MKKYSFSSLSKEKFAELLKRPVIDYATIFSTVQPIIDAVRTDGDNAVKKFTLQFDNVSLQSLMVNVRPVEQIELDPTIKSAFETAYRNISTFHKAQLPNALTVETMPGVVCQRLPRPIERVGLYIPGGSAVLPSSVLMLGVPAQLAGCRQIILATPPNSAGKVSPEVEFAAALCGIDKIFLAGGAQAVAAMAYGTESVPKVDKILGPGNQYVTAAKMMLQNSDAMIAIDMPAGPSEVLVVANETAIPGYVAADLLSQAEHGPDSQVVLVTLPGFNLTELEDALTEQMASLPRSEIAQKALENSFILECEHISEAINFLNNYAPEHLILAVSDSQDIVSQVRNAGSVFLGNWTPESVGDYASGTNHTLPTYGFARMYSGVSVDSFLRQMTVQQLTPDGLSLLGPAVEIMARSESLEAHARAVTIRLNDLQTNE
ncbi:MAG TPA: histidinol dehydrogenase [Bacteroidetes bacterium]|nr:histidinol dehydrogenase [Bacteroidota bacterium]